MRINLQKVKCKALQLNWAQYCHQVHSWARGAPREPTRQLQPSQPATDVANKPTNVTTTRTCQFKGLGAGPETNGL